MTKDEVLHTDPDGHKVILHVKSGCRTRRWVTYERYPDVEYGYLTAIDAAKEILRGHPIEHCYIGALTARAFAEAEDDIKTGQFEAKGNINIDGETKRRAILKQSIQCHGCLFREIYLPKVILTKALWFYDLFYSANEPCVIFGVSTFESAIFEGSAYFNQAFFCDNADFSYAHFEEDADFCESYFRGEADFKEVKFKGETSFAKARFAREAIFIYSAFLGSASLRSTDFRGEACFSNSLIEGEADFHETKFNSHAHFGAVEFRGIVGFGRATFAGHAGFGEAVFKKSAHFHGCAFSRDVDFISSRFSDSVSFKLAKVLCADFRDSRFEKLCDMKQIAAAGLDFGGAVLIENLILSPIHGEMAKMHDSLDSIGLQLKAHQQKGEDVDFFMNLERDWRLSKRKIYHINFENTLIQGELVCDFADISPPDGPFNTPRPEEAVIQPHKRQEWDGARRQYSWLKEQYRKRGAYGDEDEAHWWASECARMQAKVHLRVFAPLMLFVTVFIINLWLAASILAWGAKSPLNHWVAGIRASAPLVAVVLISSLLCAFPRFGKRVVSKWIFGYGVRLKNLIWTILVVIFGFGGLFWLAIEAEDLILKCTPKPFDSDCLNALYFSVITFATVGYGDVRAVGWAAGLAMVEGLLGIALNAALVVVIFRKLIR
ncbi:MAG: potassium channel family protein [Candidatus Coatesbacteria bacterium]|nr:potassium channel family protein [Candidatus Coatesbacteria bacterium]